MAESVGRATRKGARNRAARLARAMPALHFYVCETQENFAEDGDEETHDWKIDLVPVDLIWYDGVKIQHRSLDNPDP